MEWHIGCSGFYYKHWRNGFYPDKLAQNKWFEYYCQFFNTVELNNTFYRFPELTTLQGWYNRSPENFLFSVKAPRGITHFKQFHNSYELINSFYTVVSEGLQQKLGPVLFQLPPRFSYSEERLQRIIDNLNPAFNNVLEFRHETWWREDVYQALADKQIVFCGMSHPQLPDTLIMNTQQVYYRFHGVPDLYKSGYSTLFMENIVETIQSANNVSQGWFYFNNDVALAAITNAREMEQLTINA
ncbi:DUF72 domain-containing protein [Inquilinus sp. KBS0705]|nr:DUF72 domain-containing protein [Inquilinus sp. KBS0705]